MARQSYQQRIARGLARGLTRQEARGHGESPERPIRALASPERYLGYLRRNWATAQRIASTPAGARAWATANDRRLRENKASLVLGPPGDVAPGQRQNTVESLSEAERQTSGIPAPYARIYIHPGGFTVEIDRREGRRRRAA